MELMTPMQMKEFEKRMIAETNSEIALIKQHICPRCHSSGLSALRDGRQAGAHMHDGSWHNIHCKKCGYRVDMVL